MSYFFVQHPVTVILETFVTQNRFQLMFWQLQLVIKFCVTKVREECFELTGI